MARRTPLPSSRENLTDLLRQVDRSIEYHSGLRTSIEAACERRGELEAEGRGWDAIVDPLFRLLNRRWEHIHMQGVPPVHAFAEHINWPFDFDPDDPDGLEKARRKLDELGPESMEDAIIELRRDIASKLEELDRPWIEGYQSELNRACGVVGNYGDYFERASRDGELEVKPISPKGKRGVKKRLAIRFKDKDRNDEVRLLLRKTRGDNSF